MSGGLNRDWEVVPTGDLNGGLHVSGAGRADDGRRPAL
jgi:hypothetical protein